MLDKIFKLKENKTSISKELVAALTTFMSMAYVIFVIPQMLSNTGMSYNAVYGATILASALGTLLVGLLGNVPYAQSAGIGLASLITWTICGKMGYTWEQALAMIFICGIINVLITITSIRKKIIKAIPIFIQDAITVGIGLFISYIGLINSGFITFSANSLNDGIAEGVIPSVTSFNTSGVVLSLIGLIILIILLVKKVKGAYLIGIILTTLIGIPLGVTSLPDFSNYTILPSISSTFMKLDFSGLFSSSNGVLVVLISIFTLCVSDLFDTIGVFIGTGKKSGIFKLDKEGNMPKKLERALFADSIGTVIGSLLGTSNITTYVESSVGIEQGGRTGLTSIFVSLFFLATLLISPIIKCVPLYAISPVLILIGVSMINNVKTIEFENPLIGIPAFFVIIMMPLSYSIVTGIEFGFVIYMIVNVISGNAKKVSPIIYICSVLFIIKYIFSTV